MSTFHEIAREVRALKRDNARDAIERAVRQQVDLTHAEARPLVDAVLTELTAWLEQHNAANSAALINEFAP